MTPTRRKKQQEPEPCVCGSVPTDTNWREHYDHWIELTARELLAKGYAPDDVGTAFQPAMNRILLTG